MRFNLKLSEQPAFARFDLEWYEQIEALIAANGFASPVAHRAVRSNLAWLTLTECWCRSHCCCSRRVSITRACRPWRR